MTTDHAGGLDVFDVRDQLIEDYRSFTTAFVEIDDSRIKEYVADQLDAVRLGRRTIRVKAESIERLIEAHPVNGWRGRSA